MARMMDLSSNSETAGTATAEACIAVENRVVQALASDLPPVADLCRHLSRYHGKMVRPTLTALSGLAAAAHTTGTEPARVSDDLVTLGAVVEMVHLATLVHDDVLDEADQRRQSHTVNRLAGNEAAVILGDYVFSAAFSLCSTLNDASTTLAIGRTGMALCAGELLQLHHRGNFSLDEPTYFELVKGKTASLIAASASLGCKHGTGQAGRGDDALQSRFESFGELLGVAFQVQDDLLDLTGDQRLVGKSLGKDVEKGKLTLPLIHHLATAPPAQRGQTLRLVQHPNNPRAALLAALHSTGSIDHARSVAGGLIDEAKGRLAPLAPSSAKRILLSMADAVVSRNH